MVFETESIEKRLLANCAVKKHPLFMDLDVIVINISYLKLITEDISMIKMLKFLQVTLKPMNSSK